MKFGFFYSTEYNEYQKLIAAILNQALVDSVDPKLNASFVGKFNQKTKARYFLFESEQFGYYCDLLDVDRDIAREQCRYLVNAYESGELQAFIKKTKINWESEARYHAENKKRFKDARISL